MTQICSYTESRGAQVLEYRYEERHGQSRHQFGVGFPFMLLSNTLCKVFQRVYL